MLDRVFSYINFISFEIGCPYCYGFLLHIDFWYNWQLFLFTFCFRCSVWIYLVCLEMHRLVLVFLQKNWIIISIKFMNRFFCFFLSNILAVFFQIFCLELLGYRLLLSFFLFACYNILRIIPLFIHQRLRLS